MDLHTGVQEDMLNIDPWFQMQVLWFLLSVQHLFGSPKKQHIIHHAYRTVVSQ